MGFSIHCQGSPSLLHFLAPVGSGPGQKTRERAWFPGLMLVGGCGGRVWQPCAATRGGVMDQASEKEVILTGDVCMRPDLGTSPAAPGTQQVGKE